MHDALRAVRRARLGGPKVPHEEPFAVQGTHDACRTDADPGRPLSVASRDGGVMRKHGHPGQRHVRSSA